MRDYIHEWSTGSYCSCCSDRYSRTFEVVNIGTGEGLSVLQMIKEFQKQSGKTVPYQIGQRRPGDAAKVWADASKAIHKLSFKSNVE